MQVITLESGLSSEEMKQEDSSPNDDHPIPCDL